MLKTRLFPGDVGWEPAEDADDDPLTLLLNLSTVFSTAIDRRLTLLCEDSLRRGEVLFSGVRGGDAELGCGLVAMAEKRGESARLQERIPATAALRTIWVHELLMSETRSNREFNLNVCDKTNLASSSRLPSLSQLHHARRSLRWLCLGALVRFAVSLLAQPLTSP